jgi:hypothetical protein
MHPRAPTGRAPLPIDDRAAVDENDPHELALRRR